MIFTKEEIGKDVVLKKIENRLKDFNYEFSDTEKNLIVKNTYPQIENIIDRLFKTDFSLSQDCLESPNYNTDIRGYIDSKDPLIRRVEIVNSKEGILNFLDDICIASVGYSAKGVIDDGNRKKR